VSDSTGAGLIKEAMTSNGLDLLTRVIGTASGSGGLISGFAYYEVGKVVFDTWIARDTRLCSPRIRVWKLNSLNVGARRVV